MGMLIEQMFNVHSLTLGSSYRLTTLGGPRGAELSLGGQLTGYFIPTTLQNDRYSGVVGYVGPGYGKLPLSASVYLRLTAPWMEHEKHENVEVSFSLPL